MLFRTVGQSHVFLTMLYAGVAIGVWYTLLEALRRLMEAGAVLSLMMDVFFGVGAAALILFGAWKASRGELRLYAILGALCGFVIFRSAAVPLLHGLRRLARRVAGAVANQPLLRKIFR